MIVVVAVVVVVVVRVNAYIFLHALFINENE
jgi:hypothetical protein